MSEIGKPTQKTWMINWVRKALVENSRLARRIAELRPGSSLNELQMNCDAVRGAVQRMVEKDHDFADACVIDRGSGECNEETKEQTYGCCFLFSLEGVPSAPLAMVCWSRLIACPGF
jgi:hypothetical protein